MSKINIEQQYSFFLEKMNLNESLMDPVEKIERKRAWMSGFSQALVFMTQEVPNLSDEDAENEISNIIKECREYWNKETNNSK